MIDEAYKQFATKRQIEYIDAYNEHGSLVKAAKAIAVNPSLIGRGIQSVKKKAALHGYAPDHDMTKVAPPGFSIKGTSTLYGDDGQVKVQWIKTHADAAAQMELMREALEAMVTSLPVIEQRGYDFCANENLMAFYPLGDAHIGMRAWAFECGENWDLAIAERKFIQVFDRLVKTAPKCKESVIINLGDWFHVDNISNVTERSGHRLDADGRYSKIVEVGVTIIRRMIESALDHHENVRVISAIGNHDDTGAMFLSVALKHIYENEPRVRIDQSHAPFHYVKHGLCLVGVHHGHTCKPDKLPLVMASDKATEWGETQFRYWYTGHIHHDSVKEYSGCKVESFRTIAAKDAYSTWGGYRAGQDSKCIVLDSRYGEVERHTVNIAMVSHD